MKTPHLLATWAGITGSKHISVCPGFSDYDTWGEGLAVCMAGYSLDAPEYMPGGSSVGRRYPAYPLVVDHASFAARD